MSGRLPPYDFPSDEDPDGWDTRRGHAAPMPCPFTPCAAMALPLVHRLDPHDVTKTATVYPIHEVVGRNSWFGRCPASQLVVMPALTERGRTLLADSMREYARRLAERINDAHAVATAELGADADDETFVDFMRTYLRGTPAPPAEADYFPGRPADAPEPGVGEPAAAPVPLDQPGQSLGRAEEMSTREQHMQMIAACRKSIGEAQEKIAVCLVELEQLEGAAGTLPPIVTAAHGLVHATVGAEHGQAMPEPAAAMRANISAALDTVTGADSVQASIGLVRARISALAEQLGAASDRADEYAAMPK